MIIAIVASHKATVSTSECAWYFVAFTFDTTLGVVITIALHRACLHVARVVNTRRSTPLPVLNALIECGYYGTCTVGLYTHTCTMYIVTHPHPCTSNNRQPTQRLEMGPAAL